MVVLLPLLLVLLLLVVVPLLVVLLLIINEILICFSFGQIFFHSSDRGCLGPFAPLESHLNWGQMLYFHFSLLLKSKIQERKKTRFKSKSSGSLHKWLNPALSGRIWCCSGISDDYYDYYDGHDDNNDHEDQCDHNLYKEIILGGDKRREPKPCLPGQQGDPQLEIFFVEIWFKIWLFACNAN